MEKKKGPLIAVWIAIAVLGINQMLAVRHEYRMHQMMMGAIDNLRQDILEIHDRETELLRSLGSLTDILEEIECNQAAQ